MRIAAPGVALVNATDGTLVVNTGSGGPRNITGELTNAGVIQVQPSTLLRIQGVYNAAGGSIVGPGYVLNSKLNVAAPAATPTTILLGGQGDTLTSDNLTNTTLWVQGSNIFGHALLTAPNGFTNEGTVRLESINSAWSSNLTVSNGALTNAPGGVVQVTAGSGGPRTITGSVNNEGTLNVGSNSTLAVERIANGPAQIFNQRGGAITADGIFRLNGGLFNFLGGSTSGNVYVVNSQLDIAPTVTTISTIRAGGTGTTLLNNLSPAVTVWVQGNNLTGHATLATVEGARNLGTVRLESANSTWSSLLQLGGASFINEASGVIEVNQGSGGARTIAGNLVNAGKIKVAPNAFLSLTGSYTAAGGDIEGAGYIASSPVRVTNSPASPTTVLVSGANSTLLTDNLAKTTLWVQGNNAFGHAKLTMPATVTNHGTVRLESINSTWSSDLAVGTGAELVNADDGTIMVNTGSGGPRNITGTVTNAGVIQVQPSTLLRIQGVYNAAGGSIVGPGYVIGSQLNVTAPAATPTTILLGGQGDTLMSDNLADTTLWVQGSNTFGHALLTSPNGFTNQGTLQLESINSTWGSNLTVTTGALTNAASGVIQVNAGSGGPRVLSTELNNQGTVNLNLSATIGRTGANHANSGLFNVTSGTSTMTGNFAQTATGTFAVTLGGVSGRLNISGAAVLDGTLTINLANGFAPAVGNNFQIMGFVSRTGQFATVNGTDIGSGRVLQVNYSNTGVTLTVVNATASLEQSTTSNRTGDFFQTTLPLSIGGDLSVTPVAVASSDVNGDGVADLITGNKGTDDVSVLLGRGDGTFAAPQRFVVGKAPVSLAVADVNRDDKADIVAANAQSDDVSVLFGNGDGTFQPQQRFTVGANPSSVAVADINRDGISDLVTANQGDMPVNIGADVSVLLGKGDGTFQAEQRFAAGDRPLSIAIGHLNKDGALDLVTANGVSGDVSVLLGKGDGTFQARRLIAAGTTPTAVALADLDQDNALDVIATDISANEVSVLLNEGNGTFQVRRRFAVGSAPAAVVMSDVNRDHILDIITANVSSDDMSILLGTGAATFQSQQRLTVGKGPRSLVVVDLNSDGAVDVVTANSGSGNVSVVLQQ